MTPSVRVRLRREGLREAMKRRVRERMSREASLDDPRLDDGEQAAFGEAGRPGIADPPILTKS